MAPMEDQIKRAISLGFDEMVFTDHHESVASDKEFSLEIDLSNYIDQFNRLKDKYKKQITLKLGAEIGYESRGRKQLDKFVQDHPFEFVICSLHSLEGDDFYYGKFFLGKPKKQAFTEYFIAIKECIDEFKNFDVLGHLDFICRYGDYSNFDLEYLDYKVLIDDILRTLIQAGKGIEINSSGLRYGVGHMHPRLEILKRYKELGGEIITIGSDAHTPRDIGAGHMEARALLKEAGFEYFTTFNKRKPEFRKL